MDFVSNGISLNIIFLTKPAIMTNGMLHRAVLLKLSEVAVQ